MSRLSTKHLENFVPAGGPIRLEEPANPSAQRTLQTVELRGQFTFDVGADLLCLSPSNLKMKRLDPGDHPLSSDRDNPS